MVKFLWKSLNNLLRDPWRIILKKSLEDLQEISLVEFLQEFLILFLKNTVTKASEVLEKNVKKILQKSL